MCNRDPDKTIVKRAGLKIWQRVTAAGLAIGHSAARVALLSFLISISFSALFSQSALASDTFPGTTISGSGSLTGSNSGATAQTGEPTPDGNTAFQPLNTMWYSWTAPSNGILVVQTCGSTVTSFDTVLGLFTGAAVNALTQIAANDDTANCSVATQVSYGSSITQTVTSGTTYRVQVDGYGSATGTFNLQYAFTASQPIIVVTTDSSATEGGDTGSFNIRLGSAPTANVTVAIAADPATPDQCTFSTASLTFTTANWNTPQNVTVTAVNDTTAEGTHSCTTGAITATGGGFTGQTGTAPTFTITDNDTQAVSVLNTDNTAIEGGLGGAFTVRLLSAPTANVTVTIGADPAAPDQCTFSTASLTFTTGNWATAQTVTVTAVNDALAEGAHTCTTGAIVGNGGGYVNVAGTAPTFSITDNDQGLLVSTTDSSATEGADTGAFNIVLTSLPTATVTVTIAADPTGQCTFAATTLTFTTANWNTAQTVAATAVNDAIVEGGHTCSTGAISAAGGDYAGITGTAPSFTVIDNDTGTIVVTTTTATATEGGATGAFTVALGLQPSVSVTVTIAVDPAGQCTFASATLTFTTANWATAQPVTTTAVNDVIVEGAHSCTTGAISASGGGYTGVTGTAPTFTITDNDVGTLVVATTTATATEGGATGAFTVALGLQPSASVTVTIAVDPSGQCTFASATLTFTTANWATAQPVTTTAVNDLIVEGAHSCTTGTISASGGGYTGVTGTAPTFTITDNDTASITLAKDASVASVGSAGGVINYTIQISNTGNVAATAITVTDTLVSVVCPTSGGNTIATLAPSTSETCTASYTATQVDFDTNGGGDGDIDNSASASGTSGGVPVSASDSEAVLCTQNPALTLVKSANQAGPLTAGQTIVYSFVATNTGNVTLSDVSIDETAFNGTSPPLGTPTGEVLTDVAPLGDSSDSTANNGVWTDLKPGDSVQFQISYTVTQNDVDVLQ